MGPDLLLAQGEIPYMFPPGGGEGVRPAVGQATAQHLGLDIGHLVTYLLSPGWCQVLLEAFH